jgi:hypothetical protein
MVLFVDNSCLLREFAVFFEVIAHIAKVFLYLSYCLKICAAIECIPTDQQKLNKIFSNVTTSNIQTFDLIVQREAIIYRNAVRDTITSIEN